MIADVMTSEHERATGKVRPQFSIIVPAYNAASTLGRTLDSVRAQTYDDWECVVVDDGSTDTTAALLADYASDDSRIRSIFQENAGTAAALNTAARAATGDFLVQLGADDELLPEYCEMTAELIASRPDYDIYAANALQVFAGGKTVRFHRGERFQRQLSLAIDDVIQKPLIYGSAAIRREVFEARGGFRSEVYNEDYDFWLRALAGGARHIYQPVDLSLYHVTPNQKTEDAVKMRSSDYQLLGDLLASGVLQESQAAAVRLRQQELARNIAVRRKLYRLLGRRVSEFLIAKTRNLRGGAS